MNNITVRWANPTQTTLLWEFPRHYTVEDIYLAGKQSADMLKTHVDNIDLVLSMSQRGISTGNLVANLPQQTQRLVVVSRAMSARLLVESLSRTGLDAVQVFNLDEAYTHLKNSTSAPAAGD